METVPEVAAGTVELVGIGVEPGVLGFVVVRSKDPKVCPVGTCVGLRGERIKSIVAALGCRVSIALWADDMKRLVQNVLNPVEFKWWELDAETKQARFYVANPPGAAENDLRARLLSEITGYAVTIGEYF